MPVEGRRTEMPAKHVQVYDLQTMNNERLARNANHQISNQKNTRNANTCRTNLSKNVNVNQKSQEIGEIRKIVNFISFFMTYDFVSGKEAVKELRNLHKKLKEWDRFDDPTLGERGTVQEVAEKYGWGLVAEKLLKDIRERKADDDSIEITCRMLLKAKSTKKKEKQLRKAMKKSPSDPNYGSVIKVEEEIVVPTEEVTKTLSECLFEIEKYAQEQGVEARLRKQINYEILVKKMMKNIKEGTLRNLLSKIKI